MSNQSVSSWFKNGTPWVWLNAGAVSISLVMVIGLLGLIAVRGLSHFWPADIVVVDYTEPGRAPFQLLGEVVDKETVSALRLKSAGVELPEGQSSAQRFLLKIGNRDYFGLDFRWVVGPWMSEGTYPENVVAVERREWGHFYGYLSAVKESGQLVASNDVAWDELQSRLERANGLVAQIKDIEKHDIGEINHGLESLRLEARQLEIEGVNEGSLQHQEIAQSRQGWNDQYKVLQKELEALYIALNRDQMMMTMSDGREVEIPLSKVVDAYRPNAMSTLDKLAFYFHEVWKFVSGDPREANTEGGIFPAIFGTVMMVLIMAVLVTPFGVVAAVYLKEYATQGPMIRLIRIAVNNLAGVPSIVYGVFGLGFFVYFLGGNIDELFFQASLPSPTFGTPGLLWASLTLAILTVPVVIVATEEGLSRIPRNIREGSLALGATKAETLWRTVLPMAAPAMMTGLILAVARAAGEVAPLMMVGVVKLAPALAVDSIAPYLHLDRQFMHLGFHIYDVGFQSPNVEAARPLVYATALLLVMIIIVLNITAISIRNRLRENSKASEN
ncbi:MAG: phosphate ABC transporter permease PstA [Piscirickettsiaceae bacterium]|jgi:phosphate transport system permease protein|nr:phosphate ABC transporter permease PstA [Piscirickettsiaceae bacterium]